jgi:Spy/CpxP family protein refolding chaperone
MKINLLTASAFAAALAMPLGAAAQQTQAPPAATQSYGHHTTPSQAKLQHRWMKRLRRLNLSGDQQQRIQSLINQYSQAHPAGSPVDRDANRALRQQVMGVLTNDQQTQLHEQMRQRRAQMQQRRGQTQGSDQQAPADQQAPDRQGPPEDQGQNDQGPPPGQAPPNEQAPSNDQPSGPPPA